MLIRICLIVAIVAGLATAGISFIKVKEKIDIVKGQREDEKKAKVEAQTELSSTKKELAKTSKELKDTQTELASTQEERDKAVADATAQTKRATQLKDELDKTKSERDKAQDELAAWAALGIPVNQVREVIAQAKQLLEERAVLLDEKKVLMAANKRLDNELSRSRDRHFVVKLPGKLRGTVLVTDPKWDFVILDVGEDQGMLEFGELLVNRNGKLVAKVIVRTVQKGRSIANVVPGWKLGDVTEGDQVIPAHPAT